jgi:hypothetical protein
VLSPYSGPYSPNAGGCEFPEILIYDTPVKRCPFKVFSR